MEKDANFINPEAVANEAKAVLRHIQGEDDGVERDQHNIPVENAEWYVFSRRFLDRWQHVMGVAVGVTEDVNIEFIDNADIILHEERVLRLRDEVLVKPELSLHRDYEIVPPKVWHYFTNKYSKNTTSKIKRCSVKINAKETQVEVRLKPLAIGVLNHTGRLLYQEKMFLHISHSAKGLEIKEKLKKILLEQSKAKLSVRNIRVWKLNKEFSFERLQEQVPLINFSLPGVLLSDTKTLEESEVADNAFLLIETTQLGCEWAIKSSNNSVGGPCKDCQAYRSHTLKCPCGLPTYSAEYCMKQGTSYRCRPSSSESPSQNSFSQLGKTGLQNLGNTCFLNSGLQCLCSTVPLLKYFLSDLYKTDLNRQNPLGSGGRLAEALGSLFKEMWYGTNHSLSPWKLKTALGGFARQFLGYHQHDSQEMLSFLLDGVHEDLNRVLKKPYTSEFESSGLLEHQLAERSWTQHLARNSSVIVELMHGQYRSEVTCPLCGVKSLAFDPFLMVNLPIPELPQLIVDITFVKCSLEETPVKLKVLMSPGVRHREIKEKLEELLGLPAAQMHLAAVYSTSYLEKELGDDEIHRKETAIYAYEMPQLGPGQRYVLIEQFKEIAYGLTSSYYQKSPLSFPRVVVIDSAVSCRGLYSAVFAYYCTALPLNPPNSQDAPFKLSFVNTSRKWFYSSKHCTQPSPCPHCSQESCLNCEIPFSDAPFPSCPQSFLLRLEVVWFREHYCPSTFQRLSQSENHHSLKEALAAFESCKNSAVSIFQCLSAFEAPEQLDEHNASYCSFCKSHVQGTKKMSIYTAPQILIFHIKRFKQSGYYSSRNNRTVEFPLRGLDMSPYSLETSGVYDLYAISNHYGSMSFGHYTAYTKHPADGSWYHFDDSTVSLVNKEDDLVSPAAYVLFYSLRPH